MILGTDQFASSFAPFSPELIPPLRMTLEAQQRGWGDPPRGEGMPLTKWMGG